MFSFTAPRFPLMLPHTLTLLLIFFIMYSQIISLYLLYLKFFLGVTLAVSPSWAVLSFLGLRKFSGGKGSILFVLLTLLYLGMYLEWLLYLV